MTWDPIYTVASIRDIEREAHGVPLMERAGRAAFETALAMLEGTRAQVLVIAGPGNNGGDGLVLARHLRQAAGHDVRVLLCADAAALPADAIAAHARWIQAGGSTCSDWPEGMTCELIVDAMFGIGLKRAPAEPYAGLIARVNASAAPVLAIDIPSGLDANRGVRFGAAIEASRTVTFIGLKPGLLTGDGVDCCGLVNAHPLELDVQALREPDAYRLDWAWIREYRPARRRSAHKGSNGTLGVVGGADGMTGALLLAGRAALHAGAGKVLLGFVGDSAPAVDPGQPELMLRAADSLSFDALSAIAVGPGLGMARRARVALDRALDSALPMVMDADALNLLARDPSMARAIARRQAPTLLTPHPGEAARLLQTSVEAVQMDRVGSALQLARQFGCAAVLKGAGSICALADGRWFINGTGNPGLASAGTGDVLTGFTGALLAQGLNADQALLAAVCLHGAAADGLVSRGAGPIGLTAGELALEARRLLNEQD